MPASTMEFDVRFGPARGRGGDGGAPRRLLVVADLGGDRGRPLAGRKALAVDIDSFGAVFARIAPRLTLDVDGMAVAIDFASPGDFHPDRLFERLELFAALRRLRGELEDPAQFRRAAAALGLSATAAAATPPEAGAAAADDIERLLGRKPGAGAAASASSSAPAAWLDRWLREQIAPHVTAATGDEQRALVAGADRTITALMRRVLHDPAFQALEAAWLGVDRLVRGLGLGETLQLALLDAGRAEIDADLDQHRDDLEASALHRQLCAPADAAPDVPPWTLWVLDRSFGPTVGDVQRLAALGAIAARAGAPLVAGATVQAAGCATLADLAEPRRWLASDAPALAAWAALREAPMARWIGLVLPRVLMRLPYGRGGERVERFDFEEMPEPRAHEAYLWGCGGLAAALLAGRALQADGAVDLAAEIDLDDLPSHVYSEDGSRVQQPCAELLLGEGAGAALLECGLMPFLSWRDRNAARLLRWQSLASPAQPLPLHGVP